MQESSCSEGAYAWRYCDHAQPANTRCNRKRSHADVDEKRSCAREHHRMISRPPRAVPRRLNFVKADKAKLSAPPDTATTIKFFFEKEIFFLNTLYTFKILEFS